MTRTEPVCSQSSSALPFPALPRPSQPPASTARPSRRSYTTSYSGTSSGADGQYDTLAPPCGQLWTHASKHDSLY